MVRDIWYVGRLLWSLGWKPGRGSRAVLGVVAAGVVAVATTAYVGAPEIAAGGGVGLDALMTRSADVSELLLGVEELYGEEVAPIERALLSYRENDVQLVRRIAVSLVREAKRTQLEPRLLLAVLLVENPWLDPTISSPVGAQGLMQVMPFHRGNWKPCPPRLDDVEANICHGARIFAAYLRQEKGNVDRALLRYNGCVHGTNTPDCHFYPTHVYARAGRASLLSWRPGLGSPGAAP